MSILNVLAEQNNFTATEKRIANYMLQHPDVITVGRLKSIATAAYSSHSAVVRLAQKLGFAGFRDFQQAFNTEVIKQSQQLSDVNVNFPFTAGDDAGQIAKKMADLSIAAIQKSLAEIDENSLNKVVTILDQAQHIFLFSQGDSQLRARSFQNKLVKIGKFAIIAEEYADEAWVAANVNRNDCAFFISYDGTKKTQASFAKLFQQNQITSILLTGNRQSPLIQLTDAQIMVDQAEYSFAKIGTFASQASFEYILDTIFAVLYSRNFKNNLLNLQQKQTLIQTGQLSNN